MKPGPVLLAVNSLVAGILVLSACAPGAAPAPVAPAAPKQPAAPAPAAAPVPAAPAAPAPAPRPAAPTEPGKMKYGGTLVYNTSSITGGTDPFYNNTQGLQLLGNAYLQLIRAERGEKFFSGFKYVPDLAESWEFTSDTEIVFKLKKGIKWAPVEPLNGREVTAEDVVYSYKRFLDPQSVVRGALSGIKDIVALDKYSIKIVGEQKSLTLIERARQHPAWIISKEMVEKHGNLQNIMVGAGPFYEVRRESGVGSFWVKNPNYYDKDKVGADKMQWTFIADNSTIMAAFRAGNLVSTSVTNKNDLDALRKTNPDIQVEEAWRGGDSRFNLQANQPDKPWANYRVRKALSKAIDRQGIMDALYNGKGPWANGQIPPGLEPWGLPAEEAAKLDFLKYDPKEAKRLMTEAGFPNGFKTNMCHRSIGFPTDPTVLLVAQMWKENLGVDVDLGKGQTHSGWLGICFAGKSTDGINWIPLGGTTNWWDFLLFNVHSQGKWPATQINSKELDTTIDDIMATLDLKEQVKKAHDIQRLLLTSEKYGQWIAVPSGFQYQVAHPWAKNWRPAKVNDTWWSFVWLDK